MQQPHTHYKSAIHCTKTQTSRVTTLSHGSCISIRQLQRATTVVQQPLMCCSLHGSSYSKASLHAQAWYISCELLCLCTLLPINTSRCLEVHMQNLVRAGSSWGCQPSGTLSCRISSLTGSVSQTWQCNPAGLMAVSYRGLCLAEAFPGFSAPLIDNYKAKNGIILGKMNLAELSSTVTSINTNSPACYSYNDIGCSTPLNAYNQTRISGGTLLVTCWISPCRVATPRKSTRRCNMHCAACTARLGQARIGCVQAYIYGCILALKAHLGAEHEFCPVSTVSTALTTHTVAAGLYGQPSKTPVQLHVAIA